MALSSEALVPDVADTAPLNRREIADLLPEIPEWSLEDGQLTARFACKGFAEAVAFLNEIATFAAREDYLPDLGIHAARFVDVT